MPIIIVTNLKPQDVPEDRRIKILSAVTQLSHGLRMFERDGLLCIGIENQAFELEYLDSTKLMPIITPLLEKEGVKITNISRYAFWGKDEINPIFSFTEMLNRQLREMPQTELLVSLLQNADTCSRALGQRYEKYKTQWLKIKREEKRRERQEERAHKKEHDPFSPASFGHSERISGVNRFPSSPHRAFPDLASEVFSLTSPSLSHDFSSQHDPAEFTASSNWFGHQAESPPDERHNAFFGMRGSEDIDDFSESPFEYDYDCKQFRDGFVVEKEMVFFRIYDVLSKHNPEEEGLDALIMNPHERGMGVTYSQINDVAQGPSSVKFTLKRVQHSKMGRVDFKIRAGLLEIDQKYIADQLRQDIPVDMQCLYDRENNQLEFTLFHLPVAEEYIEKLLCSLRGALYKAGLAHCFVFEGEMQICKNFAFQSGVEKIPEHDVKPVEETVSPATVEVKKESSQDNKEVALSTVSAKFFQSHHDLSPKVWRKHPAVPTTQFVMFKPTDKKVAEELKSTLSENGLHGLPWN